MVTRLEATATTGINFAGSGSGDAALTIGLSLRLMPIDFFRGFASAESALFATEVESVVFSSPSAGMTTKSAENETRRLRT